VCGALCLCGDNGWTDTTSAGAYLKSSSDRLRAQLVCSGVDEGEVGQVDWGELNAAAAQIEVEKPGHMDARLQPLPDDGEELFLPPQVVAPN